MYQKQILFGWHQREPPQKVLVWSDKWTWRCSARAGLNYGSEFRILMRCKQTWTETIMRCSSRNRKNRYLRNFNFHDLPASIRTHGNKKFMYQMKKNISNMVLYFNQYQISNILVSRTFTHIMCVLPCFVIQS